MIRFDTVLSVKQSRRTLMHSWKTLILAYSPALIPPSRSTAVLLMNRPSIVCFPLLRSGADQCQDRDANLVRCQVYHLNPWCD